MVHDVVFAGGRVVDPETGLDELHDVAIDGRRIAAIGDALDQTRAVLHVRRAGLLN